MVRHDRPTCPVDAVSCGQWPRLTRSDSVAPLSPPLSSRLPSSVRRAAVPSSLLCLSAVSPPSVQTSLCLSLCRAGQVQPRPHHCCPHLFSLSLCVSPSPESPFRRLRSSFPPDLMPPGMPPLGPFPGRRLRRAANRSPCPPASTHDSSRILD